MLKLNKKGGSKTNVELTRHEITLILGWFEIAENEGVINSDGNDINLYIKLEDILIEDIEKNDKNNVPL